MSKSKTDHQWSDIQEGDTVVIKLTDHENPDNRPLSFGVATGITAQFIWVDFYHDRRLHRKRSKLLRGARTRVARKNVAYFSKVKRWEVTKR